LETGQLGKRRQHPPRAEIAIDGGAHFLKTSTGKTQPAATPAAAAVLFDVIAAAGRRGRSIRFQGIRRDPVPSTMPWYISPSTRNSLVSGSASLGNFRIGASALFKELLAAVAA